MITESEIRASVVDLADKTGLPLKVIFQKYDKLGNPEQVEITSSTSKQTTFVVNGAEEMSPKSERNRFLIVVEYIAVVLLLTFPIISVILLGIGLNGAFD